MDSAAQVKKLGTILGVWAHPDDEVFTCGGILAIAAQNGQRVMCLTFTKGEAGVQDAQRWPPERLAEIRTKELAAAYKELGDVESRLQDFADGGLANVDLTKGEALVENCINDCEPDTIMTFGPEGMTGHPDHKTVSEWATSVGKRRGVSVYHAVITPESYAANQSADQKFDMFFNIEMPPIVDPDLCDICISLDENVLQKKCRALKAMPSQTERLVETMGDEALHDMEKIESFVLVK